MTQHDKADITELETLRKQYTLTYASSATGGTVPIQLRLGNDSASAEFVAGSSQEGAASLRPLAIDEPGGPAFFRSSAGLAVAPASALRLAA